MKKWNPYTKPPADECPEEFCFNWAPKGSKVALGIYPSVAESLKALVPVSEGTCVWSFGLCRRLYPHPGLCDHYEPHEPKLERHGLPWFYFSPARTGCGKSSGKSTSANLVGCGAKECGGPRTVTPTRYDGCGRQRRGQRAQRR